MERDDDVPDLPMRKCTEVDHGSEQGNKVEEVQMEWLAQKRQVGAPRYAGGLKNVESNCEHQPQIDEEGCRQEKNQGERGHKQELNAECNEKVHVQKHRGNGQAGHFEIEKQPYGGGDEVAHQSQ